MSPRRWSQWLRDLRARQQVENELQAELDFHLQTRADQLEAEGLMRAEALRRARLELGMVELHRAAVHAARGLSGIDHLLSDVRYALRSLWRSPLYALTAMLVLALPLAAAVLLHAIYDVYVYQSPPIQRLDRWVHVQGHSPENRTWTRFTAQEADALLAHPPSALAGLYSQRTFSKPLQQGQFPRGMGMAVSANYFQQLGVGARLGRVFDPAQTDDAMGVVLSEAGWAQLFQRDPEVVGRTLDIGGHAFSVIGVAAQGYDGAHPIAQLMFVLQRDHRAVFAAPASDPTDLTHEVAGFLATDADPQLAAQQLQPLAQSLNHTRPADLALAGIRVERAVGRLNPGDRVEMQLASMPAAIAILLMLLVASANLANLVLARFSARAGELGVRAALGASRLRLLRQLWLECGVLGVGASLLALSLAALLLEPLHGRIFGLIAEMGIRLIEVQLSARSLLPALLLALLCTLAFGLLPALWVTRYSRASGQSQRLGQALRGRDLPRLRSGLVVLQIAASCFLLVVAGLIAANARRTVDTPLGYTPERLVGLSAGVAPERLVARLRTLQEVEAVGASSVMPLMGEPSRLAARALDDAGQARSVAVQVRPVDAAWPGLLGLKPLRGRLLRGDEDRHAGTAVISRATAERLWPGMDPLGRSLDLIEADETAAAGLRMAGERVPVESDVPRQRRVEVVGVVPDIATGFLIGGSDGPVVYTPARIGDPALSSLLLQLRDTRPVTLATIYAACAALSSADACMPTPLTDALRIQRLPVQVAAEVAGGLGMVALAISCLGLYGLVAYGVQQRRRELGLRLALGASRQRILAAVMGRACRQIGLGLLIGLPLAFALSRLLAQLTDRLALLDPWAFIGVPVLLAGLTVLAAFVPARASTRINPSESLRSEH